MFENLVSKMGDFLVTQGWAGVIVLLAVGVAWRQSKIIETLGTKLETAYAKQTEIQEKRVSDAIVLVGTARDVSSSLDRLGDLIRDRKTAA
jgi:hypothetical protein